MGQEQRRRREGERRKQQTYTRHQQSLRRVADAADIKEAVSSWMEGLNSDKEGRLRHFLKVEKLKNLFESPFFAVERDALTKKLNAYAKKHAYKNFLKDEWNPKVREMAFQAFSMFFHPDRVAQMNDDVKVGLGELYAFN